MSKRFAGLKGWFLTSGCVGLIIAVALSMIASHCSLSPKILLTLWPPSIIGIADPSTLSDKILFAMIEFGGNFLIYGIVGTGLGIAVRLGSRMR